MKSVVVCLHVSVLCAGINTGIAPMYLSEISTVGLRGLCGTFNQLCITLGVLTSTVVGLNTVLGRSDTWQYAFGENTFSINRAIHTQGK